MVVPMTFLGKCAMRDTRPFTWQASPAPSSSDSSQRARFGERIGVDQRGSHAFAKGQQFVGVEREGKQPHHHPENRS